MKAKTINEIHSEAEKNLGLRPGATASIRNSRAIASGAQASLSPGGFVNRPGSGGMMPGMPGTRKMPGMPGVDNDNWEVPKSRSGARVQQPPLIGKSASVNQMLLPQGSGGFVGSRASALLQGSGGAPAPAPAWQAPPPFKQAPTVITAPVTPVTDKPLAPAAKLNTDELRRKTVSLLEEYFSVRILDEAMQCLEELRSPAYHPEVVKEAISLGLDKGSSFVGPVAKLLKHLHAKNVINSEDLGAGCMLYAALLEDLAIDLPKAPATFGEVIGELVLEGALDFKVVREILAKVGDDYFQKAVFASAVSIVGSGPGGKAVLDTQASGIEACKNLT